MEERRKRRTREHVIADLSVNHVERHILRCGWVPRRMNPDYGIDLFLETYSPQGDLENGGVWLQLKATDRLRVLPAKQAIPVRLEWRDVLFWLNERMPGILVIYDAPRDRAWWLHLQAALANVTAKRRVPKRATLTLHVPTRNRLDAEAIRRFARMRDDAERKGMEEP